MSKITEKDVTSVTCGFFNSMTTTDSSGNTISDRRYDAEQMSAIFDGLINDGVFASIGDALVVRASADSTKTSNTDGKVYVGTGKCWFDHTWTRNDAILPIQCSEAPALQTRIDAIVVQVNSTPAIRDNFIMYKEGTPSQSNPTKPTLKKEELIHEYALCYITRKPGSGNTISDADIDNCVGTNKETPFVTGIVDVLDLQTILTKWSAQLDNFIADGTQEMTDFMDNEKTEYNTWYAEMKQHMADVIIEVSAWTTAEKNTILNWFNEVKGQLSEDPAFNLQNQIDANTVERLLIDGLSDGTKTISEDGTVIHSVDSKGWALTKTFTDNFSTITSVLTDREIKEYLSYPYVAFDGKKTATRYGVTFTDNGDGTVTANGTATGVIWFILPGDDFMLPQGLYSLSGCPVGGSEETYYFGASLYNDNTIVTNSTANDTGYGVTLDTTDKTYTSARVFICIKSGVTVNNVIFNPKILTSGSELGRLVKKISADGTVIESTLTNNSAVVPNLVEIERAVDAIIANENSYIEE